MEYTSVGNTQPAPSPPSPSPPDKKKVFSVCSAISIPNPGEGFRPREHPKIVQDQKESTGSRIHSKPGSGTSSARSRNYVQENSKRVHEGVQSISCDDQLI
jgi:hypothetical protein